MNKWVGAAGICVNSDNQLLIVQKKRTDGQYRLGEKSKMKP